MITVEGDAVANQLDKLQDEIGKLREVPKVDRFPFFMTRTRRFLRPSPSSLPTSIPCPTTRNAIPPFPFRRLEKLELLRQNVSCQHEVQRLRDREMQLQADLNTASREINRLRDGFVTSIMAAKSRDEPTGGAMTEKARSLRT